MHTTQENTIETVDCTLVRYDLIQTRNLSQVVTCDTHKRNIISSLNFESNIYKPPILKAQFSMFSNYKIFQFLMTKG